MSLVKITIKGQRIRGRGEGRVIGFPTVNLPYAGKETGVFAGEVRIKGESFPAAVNLGARPSVDNERLCEIHIIDWEGEVACGEEVVVTLSGKLREVKKFGNLKLLKKQIAEDVKFAKSWYNRTSKNSK